MTLSKKRLAAALFALVPLAGCGSIHPGVAAKVGDTNISLDDVDTFARGLCVYTTEAQGAPAAVTQARSLAVTLKVHAALADAQAKEAGFVASQGSIGSTLQSMEAMLKGKVDDDVLDDFIAAVRDWAAGEQFAEQVAQQELTTQGAELSDDAISQATAKVYADWAAKAGVTIDPRLGAWSDAEVTPASGSVSEAASDDDSSSKTCG